MINLKTMVKGKYVHFILFIFLFMAIFYLSINLLRKRNNNRPNIVLITVDALRADHLSTYGYKYNTSPNIDKLSKKSLIFKFCFCTIPKTSASFASIMTGLHPFIHKTLPNLGILNKKFDTLAEVLKRNGYYTYAIVDNGNLAKEFLFNQGFDNYIEVWKSIENKNESSKFITEKAIKFLKSKRRKPFFLWLHYIETHTPYIPPERFSKEFLRVISKGRNIKKLKNKIILGTANEQTLLKKHPYEGYFTALYDGAIKFVDNEIGRVINFLHKKNLYNNTIVILSADHGEDIGDYNLFYDHGPLTFNSAIRVPLIVHIPGKKHKVIKKPVSNMDIYPTILSIIGAKPRRKLNGRNLFDNKRKFRLFYIFGLGSFSVISSYGNHYSYVLPDLSQKLGIPKNNFFNFFKDPNEKDNIYKKNKSFSEIFKKKYSAFFRKHPYKLIRRKKRNKKLSKKSLKSLRTLGYIK